MKKAQMKKALKEYSTEYSKMTVAFQDMRDRAERAEYKLHKLSGIIMNGFSREAFTFEEGEFGEVIELLDKPLEISPRGKMLRELLTTLAEQGRL